MSAEALRILVLADANSIHTEKWVRGLADSGVAELRLVTMNPAGIRPGLRDIRALRRIDEFYAGPVKESGTNVRYLLNVPRVIRAVRRMKPDAIVAIYLSSYGLMGAIAKGDAALVHVMIGSDVMVAPGRSRLYDRVTRSTLARGDLLVSASRVLTEHLADLTTVPPEEILTQQYGLEDWIIEYPSQPSAYDFVSNRAWVENSRIPMLLRIFARLRRPTALALVGGDGPYEARIRELAAADRRVDLLGVLAHREAVDVVARSRFYLSMTASDGASLSLMEAMAVGAIPVVSDIEPNREWIRQGVNGALVPLDDEAAAAAAIEALLARPEAELATMRDINRGIIAERGSLTRNMARFQDRLRAIVAQRERSEP